MRVAVLGTGTMGAAMARNIARAGNEVRAWNRTRERAAPLASDGIAVTDEPAEAVAGADAVMTMLSDGNAVAAVADVIPDGVLWWQASTIGLEATERLSSRARADYVDAPVLGTRAPAEQGSLIVLASGPRRHECDPLFDAVGNRTVDLGDKVGNGTRMKLVLNAWLVALTEGLAESLLLAEGLGVDPRTFLDIIDGGPMGPPYARLKGDMMIERSYDPSFALSLAHKDAVLVDEAAREAGIDLPLARVIAERMQAAIDAGHGDEDMAATVEAGRR
jgi:3-hydroxyisobutyrate dehydrogenase